MVSPRGMRSAVFVMGLWVAVATGAASASADESRGPPRGNGPKPWCAPEVSELSDHVCYFDGGAPPDGRKTLVVCLHGVLATTPGFQWLQQRAMAIHAQPPNLTVLFPPTPQEDGGHGRATP